MENSLKSVLKMFENFPQTNKYTQILNKNADLVS